MDSKNNRPSLSDKNTSQLRLSYLRTAWNSSDIYKATLPTPEPQSLLDQGDRFGIQLPTITVNKASDEIQKQVSLMILVGHFFCLLSSVCTTFVVYNTTEDWTRYAYLLFFIVWWTAAFFMPQTLIDSISWTSLFTALIFYQPLQAHLGLAFLPAASFPLHVFAGRLLKGEKKRQVRIERETAIEQERVQSRVDKASKEYRDHQDAFMETVSQEIQDVALMVITTLEQFSPTSILHNTHELLTACSLAIPTTSVFAINTTIRQICHLSSHLQLLSSLVWRANSQLDERALPPLNLNEFDIGELLQNIGDAMAGFASYHGLG
ncbi:hypothetical protein G6F56_010903 [Rhizopus delemar]|nr:hypothetical protein G6F56_010903 [Rhizopus delemar]